MYTVILPLPIQKRQCVQFATCYLAKITYCGLDVISKDATCGGTYTVLVLRCPLLVTGGALYTTTVNCVCLTVVIVKILLICVSNNDS